MNNRKIRSREHVRKKWRRVFRYIGGFIGVLLLVVFGLIGLTRWSQVQINSFSVSVPSDSELPQKDMEKMVDSLIDRHLWGIIGRDNIALLPRSAITSKVERASPRIRSAGVDLTGLRSFTVNVTVREPVGVACASGDAQNRRAQNGCRHVDKEGFMYAQADTSTSSDLLVYTKEDTPKTGNQLLPKKTFTILQSFINNLSELGLSAQLVSLQDQRDVSITVKNAETATTTATSTVEIRLDLSDSLNQAYTDLKTVIEKDAFVATSSEQAGTQEKTVSPFALEYIDLRFGNKVFYK
jgi:hypothetical protein